MPILFRVLIFSLSVVTCRGYDFGYLLKLLTASPLPPVESEFFDALHIWFPHVYDIKHIMRSVRSLKGGLQEIADMMNVSAVDEMLCWRCFLSC